MRATADRVIVKPIRETKVGGVILPETAMERPERGEILHLGPDVEGLNEGDEVYFSKYGGTELEHEDEELIVLRAADVLAVI